MIYAEIPLVNTGITPPRRRRWLVPGAREATAMPRAGGPWRAALTRPKARSGWISMQCAVGRVLSQFSFEAIEVCSLSVTYDAKGGRATMAVSFKGAHFPPEIIRHWGHWRRRSFHRCVHARLALWH